MKRCVVTGASRGIGKAIAIGMAELGYDVAICARTVRAGEARENSLTVHRSDTRALPGSLEETAEAIEALGVKALPVAMDLTDRASVGAGAQLILDRWGDIDLLVHNGRYLGPGLMDVFLDTPIDAYGKFVEAHMVAPAILTRYFLPGMLRRHNPRIVMITSNAGYTIPPGPAGKGGWGLAYAVGKAAGHQLMPTLHVEYSGQGLLAFNVNPGFVGTERNEIAAKDYGRELSGSAPPAAIAAVIKWLVSDPEASSLSGVNIEAQPLCHERKLYPDWR